MKNGPPDGVGGVPFACIMSNGRHIPDDLLSAYRDGELAAAERDAVERLLEDSADARSELEDYQALSELLREVPGERAPAGFRAAVMSRIERESLLSGSVKPIAARRPRRFWLAGSLLAGSVAGLLVAVTMLRDGAANRGGMEVASSPAAAELPRGRVSRELTLATDRPFADDAVLVDEARTTSDAAAPPRIAAGASLDRFGSTAAASPPAGARPGDSYSYTEWSDDGEVLVVEAYVVDVELGLNRLQYFLAKNSIAPQTVSVDGTADVSRRPAPPRAEYGVLVVSDPEQINAALAEARDQSDLFVDVQLRGVLDPATLKQETTGATDPPALEAEARGGAARAARGLETELEEQVAPQARAMIAEDPRFTQTPAVPTVVDPQTPATTNLAALGEAAAPGTTPDAPNPDFAVPEAGYQQVVSVSNSLVKKQLRQEPESLAAQRMLQHDDREQTQNFGILEAPSPDPLGRLKEQNAGVAGGQNTLARQAQRKLRLLVLLEQDPGKSLKSKADATPRIPVEAPQPLRKKG